MRSKTSLPRAGKARAVPDPVPSRNPQYIKYIKYMKPSRVCGNFQDSLSQSEPSERIRTVSKMKQLIADLKREKVSVVIF